MTAPILQTRKLKQWNILDFVDGKSCFVGIYLQLLDSTELDLFEDPLEEVYYKIVGVACISSPAVWFDKINNIGISKSGREYLLVGPSKLPNGELHRMIIQKFSDSKFSYRYPSFAD